LSSTPQSGLRRVMGFWDVLLFNIAAVLGPRWIARAAHAGQFSISLWVLAAAFFFLPTALIIVELSTRYPNEGGLYVWTKEAFGDFHGFVAGWCYWMYTFFYFPGLLMASVAMSVYIGGPQYAWLADNKLYSVGASLVVLAIAVWLNLIGLNIGKWLQNAGGVGTYVPLMMLVVIGLIVCAKHGSVTHFSWNLIKPNFDFDTLNFWSGIAFAFTGMELVCAMSEEVKDPHKTFPRSIYASTFLIALIYILGTIAVLLVVPTNDVNTQNGVFQAIGVGSTFLKIAWFGVLAALLVTVGNAGGVGATVAGVARVPFVAGIDNYLPKSFGRLHPKWKTPYVAILVQAVISGVILVLSNVNETLSGAYEALINATIIIYFVPFLYMYAAAIRLAYRQDRGSNPNAVLVPGGRVGMWIMGLLGFGVTAVSIVFSLIPSKDVTDKGLFVVKVAGGTIVAIAFGLFLYARGARRKRLATAS
jgi:amino acid transporter